MGLCISCHYFYPVNGGTEFFCNKDFSDCAVYPLGGCREYFERGGRLLFDLKLTAPTVYYQEPYYCYICPGCGEEVCISRESYIPTKMSCYVDRRDSNNNFHIPFNMKMPEVISSFCHSVSYELGVVSLSSLYRKILTNKC